MSGILRFRETVALWLGICLTVFLIVAVITSTSRPWSRYDLPGGELLHRFHEEADQGSGEGWACLAGH